MNASPSSASLTLTRPPQPGDIWRERRRPRGSLPPRYVQVVSVLSRSVEIITVQFLDSQRGPGRWFAVIGAPHRLAALSRFNGRGSGYELHLPGSTSS